MASTCNDNYTSKIMDHGSGMPNDDMDFNMDLFEGGHLFLCRGGGPK